MSLNLNEINALTQDYWEPGAHDQYFKGNALMYRLLKKGRKWSGGDYLRVVIQYGQPVGGSFNAQSKFDTSKREELNAARFAPAYYYEPVTFDIDDKVRNAGSAAQVDIVAAKLTNAQKKIRQSIAVDFYNNSTQQPTGRGMLGLPAMMSSSTTSYGQISSSDIAEWTTGVANTTGYALSYAIMRAGRTSCQVGDGIEDKPTIMITTRTLFDVVEGQTQVNQRYEEAELAEVGFQNLVINGIPLVSDYLCPSGYLYFLNENLLDMKSHKDFFFVREPWMRPVDQYVYTTQLIWVGQLLCKRRNAHGFYSSLS
jgi:hypothetical protein